MSWFDPFLDDFRDGTILRFVKRATRFCFLTHVANPFLPSKSGKKCWGVSRVVIRLGELGGIVSKDPLLLGIFTRVLSLRGSRARLDLLRHLLDYDQDVVLKCVKEYLESNGVYLSDEELIELVEKAMESDRAFYEFIARYCLEEQRGEKG